MKAIALLVLSAFVAVAAQPECDSLKLVGIVGGPNGVACTAATTYSPATLAIPTGELLKTVCSTESCKALLQEITAAVPTECLFTGRPLKSTIVDRFPLDCANALGTSAAPATATPAPSGNSTNVTAAPGATTVAPDATTLAPVAPTEPPVTTTAAPTEAPGNSTEAGSGSGDAPPSSDGSITKAPSGAVPAPAPTGGAAQLTATVGIVVAALVAAML